MPSEGRIPRPTKPLAELYTLSGRGYTPIEGKVDPSGGALPHITALLLDE
jgi:hypothetical protein